MSFRFAVVQSIEVIAGWMLTGDGIDDPLS
jgi:hypothetical protein